MATPNSHRRVLLFVAYGPTSFQELSRLARFCLGREIYFPVFIFPTDYLYANRDMLTCLREGFGCLDSTGTPIDQETDISDCSRCRRRLAESIGLAGWWRDVKRRWANTTGPGYYLNRLVFCDRLLRRLDPVAVIIPEETVENDSPVWVKAAKKLKKPSILLPYTISTASEPALSYIDEPKLDGTRLMNRLTTIFFSHWAYEFKGRVIVRAPWYKIWTLELMGLAPKCPWVLNSGHYDSLAAESKRMVRHYLAEGLPEDRMVLTGALYDDELARRLTEKEKEKGALAAKLNLDLDRPVVLWAVPPPTAQSGHVPGTDSFRLILEHVLDHLITLDGWNVVVRLHPALDPGEYAFLERGGARLADMDTAALIPLADLYVATISATIRWAIACGVPVINYDIGRTDYPDFDGVEGVVKVQSEAGLKSILAKVATDVDYLEGLKRVQRETADDWSEMDGRSGERIVALLEKLAADRLTEFNSEQAAGRPY